MALTINTITRINGAACDHITFSIDDEGTPRTFTASFRELDDLIGSRQEAVKLLCLLWAAYRRSQARTTTGVAIA